MESNRRDRVELPQPTTEAERRSIASACAEDLGLTLPVLLDGMDNAADRAFQGWPERLYVIGTDGRIAYQGGKGPYGFDPEELERCLERLV